MCTLERNVIFMDKFKEIRPIALGLAIKDNKLLVSEGYDKVKKQTFYRCLGGGIEFLEKSEDTLKREFLEEINVNITVNDFLGISENIFTSPFFCRIRRISSSLIFAFERSSPFFAMLLYERRIYFAWIESINLSKAAAAFWVQ